MNQTIADTGEFPLINQITKSLVMPEAVTVGPGDDCAVYAIKGQAVTTVDMLVEDVHFKRSWSTGQDIGRKSVAVNVSDVEAMGARPLAMVIGMGCPSDTPVEWINDFMTGLRAEAEQAKVTLVGGDMTGAGKITICVTVIGECDGVAPVLRSGAKAGQQVAYTGRLGWSAAGLAALMRGFRSPRLAVDSHRHPQVPYGAGRQAAQAGAGAMIDISDGFLADIGHIAEASKVAIDLDSAAFPIDEPVASVAQATNTDPLVFVLTGGEDHALAATFDEGTVPDGWRVVGRVIAGEPGVSIDGAAFGGPAGWTHFNR